MSRWTRDCRASWRQVSARWIAADTMLSAERRYRSGVARSGTGPTGDDAV